MPRVKSKGDQCSAERQEAIQAATTAVKAGQSVSAAARQFGIPRTTLQRLSGKLHLVNSKI